MAGGRGTATGTGAPAGAGRRVPVLRRRGRAVTAKLSSRLPDYPENGLEAIGNQLVTKPEDVVVVVVRLDTMRLTTDLDSGDIVPTARILSIEPLRDDSEAQTAVDLMRSAFEARTGLAQLPFESDDTAMQAEADSLLRHGSGVFLSAPPADED